MKMLRKCLPEKQTKTTMARTCDTELRKSRNLMKDDNFVWGYVFSGHSILSHV